MTDTLNISLVQFDINWEGTTSNIRKVEQMLDGLVDPDVVVLPEMFATGFSMKPESISVSMQHEVVGWMKRMADKMNCLMVGSLAVKENGLFYNRMLAIYPDGEIKHYNKRHLFRMAGEQKVYSQGDKRVVIEFKGWRMALFICYDLRFPVWSRNRNDYDLALYVANWPAARTDVWTTLLKARAIENQCYVAGVNRVGLDNLGNYSGDSMIIDFKGRLINTLGDGDEGVITAQLEKTQLNAFHNDFPAWMDADSFEIV
ncbi:amidohydrolase [Alkaliflexus imshenetskii]|jgi:omega-amidase|uniref:amidohydrolase n=1 Tax=Alkaliflexus imshenetskii TaxID=286730 RepID=UPI000479A93D|nr:amidohydrolase [Alkaliflexus imshenetskii]